MQTKSLTLTLKVNIGNWENFEVSQAVELDDNDDERLCFAQLSSLVFEKAGSLVKYLEREKETLLCDKFPHSKEAIASADNLGKKPSNNLSKIDDFERGISSKNSENNSIELSPEDLDITLDDLVSYGN